MKHKLIIKLLIILLILIISILHFTSNTTNSSLHQFYKLLYFIPIILAAFNFEFKGAMLTALIVSVIYSPQRLLSIGFKTEAINELLDVFLFFAIGIITGILVEKKNLAFMAVDNQLKNYVILENYINSIIKSIKSGIIAINNDFLITSINSGAIKLLDVSSNCIGQNFIEIFRYSENVKQNIFDAMSNGIAVENIEISIPKSEKEILIKINIYPLSMDNKNKGLVIIIDDITEMNKIKMQMHRNDKLASVGQLATGIAHEIRNPLAIIKMIEQTMIGEFEKNMEVVKELQIIDEEVERANKVIKSLMEFGKPSKNEKAYCSLNEIIDDVLIIINKYITQYNVRVNLEKSITTYGEFDKEQLKQAFINLIFNAVDAMPFGGEISISTKPYESNWIKIIFKDTGEGIEEKNLSKIFDPFFTTKDEGTGLGLAIVHRIIKEHEGSINVYSNVGEGTKFEIIFPITTKHQEKLGGT